MVRETKLDFWDLMKPPIIIALALAPEAESTPLGYLLPLSRTIKATMKIEDQPLI